MVSKTSHSVQVRHARLCGGHAHLSPSIEIDVDGTDKFMQTLEVADI